MPGSGNFIETLLMKVWYPITVCTNSWQIKQQIKQYADMTLAGMIFNGADATLIGIVVPLLDQCRNMQS